MNRKNKLLLLAVIITTIIVATFALSKYQSTLASKSSATTAIPVISLTSNKLNVNLEINPVDKEQDYIFQVSNYINSKENGELNSSSDNSTLETVSEVTMQYNLQIKTVDTLPLEFELYSYDDENSEKIGENLLTNSKSNNIIIGYGEKEIQTYILKIKWKDGMNNYLYNKEIDYLQLVLNSEQVD